MLEVETSVQYEKHQLASQKRLLQHQLHQFAQLFRNITSFFKQNHQVETIFLEGMAESMELLSTQLKCSTVTLQEESVKIYNLIQGYHYAVQRVDVSEIDSGQKRIEIFLRDCSKQDVYEVIIPLIKMMVDPNLKLISYSKGRFFNPLTRIELSGIKPMKLNAQTLKIKKEPDASGDTCGLFHYKHNIICTLSDGMGCGANAKKSSAFITEITQRLLSSGIPIEMAVKSMNSLLKLQREESFVTLDMMVFDAIHQEVYLSKCGACATFLLRGKEIIKIQGASLPLGIVEEVEADCYKIQCKDEDQFIMFSDGIDEDLLYDWLQQCNRNCLIQELQKHMETMEVKDDATLFLAEVLES